jgi:aryl-alcohol dehydrogenase-like predicted oxidoreductase
MQTRRLGNSDLYVSEISLGSWLTYSGDVSRDQSQECIRAAFDCGINLLAQASHG